MQEKSIRKGNRTFWTPLASHFAGLRVVPTTTLPFLVNIDHVTFVLSRPQHGHEPVVIGADGNIASQVIRSKFDTFGRIVYFRYPSARCVVLLKEWFWTMHAIKQIDLIETELWFASPVKMRSFGWTRCHGRWVEIVEQELTPGSHHVEHGGIFVPSILLRGRGSEEGSADFLRVRPAIGNSENAGSKGRIGDDRSCGADRQRFFRVRFNPAVRPCAVRRRSALAVLRRADSCGALRRACRQHREPSQENLYCKIHCRSLLHRIR